MRCRRPRVRRPVGAGERPASIATSVNSRRSLHFTVRGAVRRRRRGHGPPVLGSARPRCGVVCASLVDRSAGGIRTNRLVEDLRRRGWNAVEVEGREDLIDAELARGRPVLTLIEDRPGTFHYVVIVAATPQAIVFHDPARAPFRVMEREQFARRWSRADRWMAVVTPIESSRSSEPPAPVAADRGIVLCGSRLPAVCSSARRASSTRPSATDSCVVVRRRGSGAGARRAASAAASLARSRASWPRRRSPSIRWTSTRGNCSRPVASYRTIPMARSRRGIESSSRTSIWLPSAVSRTRGNESSNGCWLFRRRHCSRRGLFDLSARRLKELPSAIGTRLEFVPRFGPRRIARARRRAAT